MTTHPPSKIGRYQIERELGRGTMGVVYEARDTTLARVVALKTFGAMAAIAPHERDAFEQRFLSEARISAALDEPHVVTVYDVDRDFDTGLLYMALEFVKGETLAQALSRGPMPWEEAALIVAKVARALQAAHSRHIVHRDIKPANIMLTSAGEPKVMDFGIAKASASQLTVAGQVFGTPAYMSPEQASGEDVDGRSDVFSLGAVLYELVTNTRPFEGPTMGATLTKILHTEPPPASGLVRVPGALDSILGRALRKRRDDRYDSATHLASDLEHLIDGQTPPYATRIGPLETLSLPAARTPRRTSPPSRGAAPQEAVEELYVVDEPPKRNPLRLAGGIALGAILGIGVVLLLQRGGKTEGPPTTTATAPEAGPETVPTPPEVIPTPPEPTPFPSSPPDPTPSAVPLSMGSSGGPAQVSLDLRHPFASGTLRIKVDDRVVFASNIHGMPMRVQGELSGYDGRFGTDFPLDPGNHMIQVEVRSGPTEFVESARLQIRGGESRSLIARVGKTLTLSLE